MHASQVCGAAVSNRATHLAGIGYILLILALTINRVLDNWGAPHVQWLLGSGPGPVGGPGLAVGGLLGLGMVVVSISRGHASRVQLWMLVAIGGWMLAPILAMYLHGDIRDPRYWSIAGIGLGLAAASIMVPQDWANRMLLLLGFLYGWGSVFLGVSALVTDTPRNVLSFGGERYSRWLAMLGLDVDVGSVGVNSGFTPGRVYLGLTCGLLLVFSVRTLLTRRYPTWMWLSVPGMAIAILWAFSRTGLLIILVGLVASLIPWERAKSVWLVLAVFGLILVPVALSLLPSSGAVTDGTTVWRFALWRSYLDDGDVWGPFGAGPQMAAPDVADHAHQQLLEAQVVGGWLGLAGCLAFIILFALSAHRCAHMDHRAAIAVLFGMAAIFQLDVVTFANRYETINNAFVLIVVIAVRAADWRKSDSGHDTTLHPGGAHAGQ